MHRTRTGAIARMLGLMALVMLAVALSAVLPHPAHASPLLGLAGLALSTSVVPVSSQSPFAGLIPAELLGREQRTYFAPLNWAPIAAGAAVALPLAVDVNHDIVIHRLSYTARDVNGVIQDRPPLFLTMGFENGQSITPTDNSQVDIENIAGTNRGAPELVIPLIVTAGDKLVVTLTNASAVAQYVRMAFIGFRSARRRQ